MRLLKGNRIAKSSFFLTVLLCLMIQSGCSSSVEHIRLYREARQDFSDAAHEDNRVIKEKLFPEPGNFKNLLSNPAIFEFSYNKAQESMGRWDAVQREFIALNNNKECELTADALFGSSRTFQIMAQLRRDFWIHFLKAGGGQLENIDGQSKPLTEALAQAEKLVANKDVKLFERDSLLLKSLRPRVRYEIAYINASRPCLNDTLKKKTFFPIAEQMAQAEKELAEASSTTQGNLQYYFTMSRYIMLVSARQVVVGSDKASQKLPLEENDKSVNEFPTLNERVNYFRKQATNQGTPEQKLINSLGLTESDFKTTYLSPIVKE